MFLWQPHYPPPPEATNPKIFSKPWITHSLGLGESQVGQGFVLYPDISNTKAVREKKIRWKEPYTEERQVHPMEERQSLSVYCGLITMGAIGLCGL